MLGVPSVRHVALAAIAIALVCAPAQAQWSVEAGLEHFDWTEDTAPIAVHEHGPRFLAAAGWMLPRKQGPLIAYRGELYGGGVTYDGALLLDPATPVSGTSNYLGTAQAAQVRWRWSSVPPAPAILGILTVRIIAVNGVGPFAYLVRDASSPLGAWSLSY